MTSTYEVSDAELADLSDAIRPRGGAAFMHPDLLADAISGLARTHGVGRYTINEPQEA
jgi:hypothetical protein